MTEQIQCPYNGECPQIINNSNEIKRLSERMDLQNQYIIEKIDTISSDVKDVKTFLNEGLEKKIDERIEAKLNEKTAHMAKWVVTAILGSGGLSALITFLMNR